MAVNISSTMVILSWLSCQGLLWKLGAPGQGYVGVKVGKTFRYAIYLIHPSMNIRSLYITCLANKIYTYNVISSTGLPTIIEYYSMACLHEM
jgi:hypothetical protein